MSRRKEIRVETFEEEVTILACDLCGKEVKMMEHPIYGREFQIFSDAMSPNRWWRKPLERIVGLKKGYVSDEKENSDFEIHVGCGYEAIKKAIEEQR